MSQPAVKRAVCSPLPLVPQQEQTFSLRANDVELRDVPLGVFRVNEALQILEYKERNQPKPCAGPYLVRKPASLPPWMKRSGFVQLVFSAIQADFANVHVDFALFAGQKDRAIHVNILAFGDRTAWLFVSDRTLPVF
jgi:hypothetical protein